jgi:hypothetical protein
VGAIARYKVTIGKLLKVVQISGVLRGWPRGLGNTWTPNNNLQTSPARAPLSLSVLVTERMAAAPKFDVKMLIVPAILFFSKKIDFKDPNIVQLLRMSFGTGSHMCRRTTEADV